MDGVFEDDRAVQSANRLASEVKDRWRAGQRADVVSLLREHPELEQHKSVVLDLAYHEYRQRFENGESLTAEEFSRRFPALQRSLYLLIEVRQLLDRSVRIDDLDEAVVWPDLGECFLGFSLLAELGRGAFGRVFLASEPDLGNRLVALKVALRGNEEAEMLGRLRHPNIMPVHSIREDADTGLTAVCMPYLGRATLCDVLDVAFVNSRPPTWARVVLDAVVSRHEQSEYPEENHVERIFRSGSYIDGIVYLILQLGGALAYTHSRGIWHRDLKPSNVLISADCRPLLLDFNLSFDERTDASRFGGTLPYMAPEQLRMMTCESCDSARDVDSRADLFSLGVIAYELLSGSLPFGPLRWGSSIEDTARRLLEQQAKGPQPLREKNTGIDRILAHTIEKCLAFNPDCRFESAAALHDALQRELRVVCRARRWVRHWRKTMAVFSTVLVVVAVCAGVFLALRDPYCVRQLHRGLEDFERQKYELAIQYFDNAVRAAPDPSDALFARGRAYQKLRNFEMALADFRAVFDRRPSHTAAVCVGYCLNRLKYHREADYYYRIATDMGPESPAVLNNRGYTAFQLARFEDSERFLKQAVELDPRLQAAHYNLAVLYLRQAMTGQPLPVDAHFHISKAIEIGPPAVDLYRTAADLCMVAAKHDDQAVSRALGYLKKGRLLGLDATALKSDPLLRSLQHLEEFKGLLAQPPNGKPLSLDPLVDPLQ